MILLQSPPGMPLDSYPTTLSPSILPPSSSPRRPDHPSSRSSAVTPIPQVTSAVLAFVAWSDSRGAPTIGTPHDRLSSIEFHPQWPTAVWDSTFTCEHHSTTRPCSPPPSSSTPASYLLSRRTTNRYGRLFCARPAESSTSSRFVKRCKLPKETYTTDRSGFESSHSTYLFSSGLPVLGSDSFRLVLVANGQVGISGPMVSRSISSTAERVSGSKMRLNVTNSSPVHVHESFPFSIAVSWKGSAPDSRTICSENQQISVVFPKGNPIPSVKALAFYRSSTFIVDVVYADVGDMQVPAKISTYTIGPFQTSKDERAKLKVKVWLNLHGIVSIEPATMLEEEEVEVAISDMAELTK
ncbi:hypothetical protein C4D60_Mb07t20370 [Musa balbisiana]|uniref:Uncharacterized protein n=1 Tax=Musa balbisiana TaxID=52838 RepID=A0A4S8JGX7_MUSBA|nr:hypothetical protein C4D60_Mb07t20370 [Musa balbisiana]